MYSKTSEPYEVQLNLNHCTTPYNILSIAIMYIGIYIYTLTCQYKQIYVYWIYTFMYLTDPWYLCYVYRFLPLVPSLSFRFFLALLHELTTCFQNHLIGAACTGESFEGVKHTKLSDLQVQHYQKYTFSTANRLKNSLLKPREVYTSIQLNFPQYTYYIKIFLMHLYIPSYMYALYHISW